MKQVPEIPKQNRLYPVKSSSSSNCKRSSVHWPNFGCICQQYVLNKICVDSWRCFRFYCFFSFLRFTLIIRGFLGIGKTLFLILFLIFISYLTSMSYPLYSVRFEMFCLSVRVITEPLPLFRDFKFLMHNKFTF